MNLQDCAKDIKARGGNPVLVQMDHSNDADVENLFAKIKSEHGRLDLLVNNAYAGVNMIFQVEDYSDQPFLFFFLLNT